MEKRSPQGALPAACGPGPRLWVPACFHSLLFALHLGCDRCHCWLVSPGPTWEGGLCMGPPRNPGVTLGLFCSSEVKSAGLYLPLTLQCWD